MVAEAITSALTVATIMAESIIMGTATSIAAITMAMKDLPIGIMIIIADFGMVLGTSTASVRAGGGLTTTTSMYGFVARTTNCVVVCPARAWRISLALGHCQSEHPSIYFGIALKADANQRGDASLCGAWRMKRSAASLAVASPTRA